MGRPESHPCKIGKGGPPAKRDIYWYGTYEEVPLDAKLFAKPEAVKIEDAK